MLNRFVPNTSRQERLGMRGQIHLFLWGDIIKLSWDCRHENIYVDDQKAVINRNTIKQLHVVMKYV